MCVCVDVSACIQVPMESRRGGWTPGAGAPGGLDHQTDVCTGDRLQSSGIVYALSWYVISPAPHTVFL